MNYGICVGVIENLRMTVRYQIEEPQPGTASSSCRVFLHVAHILTQRLSLSRTCLVLFGSSFHLPLLT